MPKRVKRTPLVINGITYATVPAAAKLLNVPESTIKALVIKQGRTVNGELIPLKRKVKVNGQEFASITDATHTLGTLCLETIRNRLPKEREDPNVVSEVVYDGNTSLTKINLNGVDYASLMLASQATGITYGRICVAVRKQKSYTVTIDPIPRGRTRGRELTINGKAYESVSAAMLDTKFSPGLIQDLIREQKSRNITYDGNRNPVEIKVNGKSYPSVIEAVRQTGISISLMYRLINAQGYDIKYERLEPIHAVQVTVDDVRYSSIAAAQRGSGIEMNALRKMIKKQGMNVRTK